MGFFSIVHNQLGSPVGALGSQYQYSGYGVQYALDGMVDFNFNYPTITGGVPSAWISITLPETLVIAHIKAYTYYVSLHEYNF